MRVQRLSQPGQCDLRQTTSAHAYRLGGVHCDEGLIDAAMVQIENAL